PSYSYTWNTTTATNGSHTLTARARDAAGNTALSASVPVTVSNTVASGLVAAYAFNETSGTTTPDVSGNNNTGTLGGGVTRTTSGKNAGALVFNNSFVTIPHAASLNLTAGMTIEAWVYPTATGGYATVVMKEKPGALVYTLYGRAPTNPGVHFDVGGTERQLNAPSMLALNTWSHVAGTFDGSMSRLFVNGIEIASQAFAGPISTSTGAVRIGGNAVWGEYFNGRIDDVRIYNRALTAAEVVADMGTPVGDTPIPDTVAPSVNVTAPTAGATVSGTVSLSANASDNVGIASVKFFVDGAPVGAEVTTAPYSTLWNSTDVLEGPHSIEAEARDFAGNVTRSAAVPVTVSVPTGATAGLWSAVFSWPVVPIHATLLKTGEVLTWEYDGAGGPYLWNPTTNQFTAVPQPNNVFCGGQTVLPDGRLLIAGGHVGAHVGLSLLSLFDPLTRSWSLAPNMATARWYPTVTTLPDGRALITAGETGCSGCNALLPEVYNPLTNQVSTLTGASANFPYYPHTYVLPDGRIFAAATAEEPIISRVLDLSTQTWTNVGQQKLDGGSSVMYLPGKIMKTGTPHDPDLPPDPSTNKTYVIDMNAASPSWTQTAPMAFPRTYHNTTVLPDGNVLVTGGGITSDAVDQSGGVLAAEMWSPVTQTYQTMASGQVARLYHSLAILLPDARVLVAGGGRFNGFPSSDPSDHLNAEIYSPPYLFKGARPTITSAPQTAAYGASIAVQSPDA
ncbi:MAG TPA: LamG-like jellyroll fold domain-containing protein, partial [Gemmatimonadaceae bacterium]